MATWREIARRTIERTADAAAAEGLTESETLTRIDAAYPFGERRYHPYQVWLSERKRWRTGQPASAAELRRAAGSASDRARLAAWQAGRPIRDEPQE